MLSASAPAEAIPAEGTIIIAPITEKTPAGLLVKVVSVSGNVLTTEPASLEEAFEELHVDTTMDISPYLLHCIDNEGDITKPEFMTQEEWKDIMQESGETKAEASVSKEFTPVSFPFEDGEFKGSLYMKLEVVGFDVRSDRFTVYIGILCFVDLKWNSLVMLNEVKHLCDKDPSLTLRMTRWTLWMTWWGFRMTRWTLRMLRRNLKKPLISVVCGNLCERLSLSVRARRHIRTHNGP